MTSEANGSASPAPAFKFDGVNYVADVNGSFQDDDNLTSLGADNINSVAITADFGINGVSSTVYDNAVSGGYTESDEAISATISQAVGLGEQVLYRPLIDFLGDDDGTYYLGQWRADFNPGPAGSVSADAFFASYQTMIVDQAKIAQSSGATIFSIGAELDQITGPAYESYWTSIITAVRGVFSGALTYGATWDDSTSPWQWGGTGLSAGTGNILTQISFWSQLDYLGIDEYAPISNLANPTLNQLIAGWTGTPTDDLVSAVTGGASLISYFQGLSAATGKPLLFTEFGYANSSDAAINPATPGYDVNGNPDVATTDPTLQANLYTAFVDAWTQHGNGSLAGAYAWDWEPQGHEVGNVWDIEGQSVGSSRALSALANAYATPGSIVFGATPAGLTAHGNVTNGATYVRALGGFVAGDRLDITGLGYASGADATLSPAQLEVASGAVSEYFALTGSYAAQYAVVSDGAGGSEVLGLASGPVEAVAQYTANASALDALSTGFFVADSASAIAGDIAALNTDTHINKILLTDGGLPALHLTNAQYAADTAALSEIANPSYEVVTPGGTYLYNVACFVRGTRILTARGEIAIERLQVGDLAVTGSGALRTIVWIGRRALDLSKHPRPAEVRPVRIGAGAFAPDQPKRDLALSPGHNVVWDGVLVPIRALANGHSVTQVEADSVEYWHVELDAHDVLISEGLASESYLDCGNRTAFADGGAFIEAHPDFQPKASAETCLPLVTEGPVVDAARAALIARTVEAGGERTRDADAHVLADGERIEAVRLSPMRLGFVLPEGRREIALNSRAFVPAEMEVESPDRRRLGVCVARLQIDGEDFALDGGETPGWREAEFDGQAFARRWTSGSAPLPAGARLVIVDLEGEGVYWRTSLTGVGYSVPVIASLRSDPESHDARTVGVPGQRGELRRNPLDRFASSR